MTASPRRTHISASHTHIVPLRPEDSAQGSGARPNPLVDPSLRLIADAFASPRLLVDQGAGRLRHLDALTAVADKLVLVDTELQLSRRQSLLGRAKRTVVEIAEELESDGRNVCTLTDEAFAHTNLNADAILSVCVYDAVPKPTRRELAYAAERNLRRGGMYIVIVPRNDTSITARCTDKNAFGDGHLFCRGQSCTFFHNFRDHRPLVALMESAGLRLAADRSSYRHVWLQFEKT